MNLGYLLVICMGFCWALIAIVVSEAKQHQCSVPQFYLLGSLVALFIMVCVSGSELCELFQPEHALAVLCYFCGSLFNGSGQAVSMGNLKQGGRALAYAIPQQAFIFPYLWSVFFWGQRLSFLSVTGILLIVCSILFLSLTKSRSSATGLSAARLVTALVSMVLLGTSQILVSAPSQLSNLQPLSPTNSACVIFATNILLFSVWLLFSRPQRPRPLAQSRRVIPWGLAWGLLGAASYSLLFPALNHLKEVQQAGIVFPIGVSILIVVFSIFTSICFREKLNFKQKAAFCCIVLGIFLVKLC